MATAPAPATSSTMWRSGSRQERVARRKSSIPPSRTHAIGTSALISQLIRNHGNSGSPVAEALLCVVSGGKFFGAGNNASGSPDSGLATGLVIWSNVSGISVQTGEQVRDSEEGEHHDSESEDCEVSSATSTPSTSNAHVKVAGVDQPRNRRPRLFGIPIPVGTAG